MAAIAPRSHVRVWWHSNAWYFEVLQDINRVAPEAGCLAADDFSAYGELASPEQAKRWFAIAPEAAPNVVRSLRFLANDETT
jgi:hypothetical protein